MALSTHDALSTARRGRRRRRTRGALSEINVTPMVDVMLVLLIIFMVSAPLLNVGVPVDLPKTQAGPLRDTEKPLAVTVSRDGAIHLNETQTTLDELAPRLDAVPGSHDEAIYVRADGAAPYAVVAQVMATLSTSGFSKLNLVTDVAAHGAGAGSGRAGD